MNVNPKRPGRPPKFDRDAVLRSAMLTFWHYGYEGASVALLTEAMGLSPASLYAAFGSKEALYREALRLYGPSLPRPARGGESIYGQLEQLLRSAALRFTEPDHPPGCMMLTGSLRCGADASGAAQAAAEVRAERLAAMSAWFEQAKSAGDLAPQVDATGLANFYMAVLQGMSVQAIDGADAATLLRIGDHALSQWPGAHEAPVHA